MLGVQHIQSRRETKRQALEREWEIRDARRKVREKMVTPVKEALTKCQARLEKLATVDSINNKAQEKGSSLKPEVVKDIESLKESLQRCEGAQQWEALTELLPLAAAITNEEVREHVRKAFLYFAMGKKIRGELNITGEDMDKVFNLAYQKLEDFVVLAD